MFTRLLRYARRHRGRFALAALFSCLNKIFDLAPPLLIGHSMGAHVALDHASRFHDVRGLVLIDPARGGARRSRRIARLALALRRNYPSREEALDRFRFVPSADHCSETLRLASDRSQARIVGVVADPENLEQIPVVRRQLAARKVHLHARWPGLPERHPPDHDEDALRDPFQIDLPTLLLAHKADLAAPGDVDVLRELLDSPFPMLATSAQTGQGQHELGQFLFEGLQIVRVYTKTPGKQAHTDKPFTLRLGDTVEDVARLVHKDVASSLRYARLWGGGRFDGQQVGPQHELCDGDVLELHAD